MKADRYVGCAKEQVENFLAEVIRPVLEENRGLSDAIVEIYV